MVELAATLLSDVPNVAWQEVTVSTWHQFSLELHFQREKLASKPREDAFYSRFDREINDFPWSDPTLRTRHYVPQHECDGS